MKTKTENDENNNYPTQLLILKISIKLHDITKL